jgi:hypothetical protein
MNFFFNAEKLFKTVADTIDFLQVQDFYIELFLKNIAGTIDLFADYISLRGCRKLS